MNTKFSWFPGHMQKTLRKLSDEEKMVSMAIVLLDARCPRSSRNPYLESIFENKPILYILNKEDMASVRITRQWLEYYKNQGLDAIALSCKTGSGKKKLIKYIESKKNEIEKLNSNKIKLSHFRVVVIGVPNSGKSSLINLISSKRSVKTGKKPGLTRGAQWLKIGKGMEVLDSPGVMLPRMDLEDTPWILGVTAAIKQEILPVEEIAQKLIEFLVKRNLFPKDLIPEGLSAEFLKCNMNFNELQKLISKIALIRGFVKKGGMPDVTKVSLHLLKIFREGKIGRISIEEPEYNEI